MNRVVDPPGGRDVALPELLVDHPAEVRLLAFEDEAPHRVVGQELPVLRRIRGPSDHVDNLLLADVPLIPTLHIIRERRGDAVLDVEAVRTHAWRLEPIVLIDEFGGRTG